MTISQVRFSVDRGRCTWLQVHETLINAGTSHHTRRLFLDGVLELGQPVDDMLALLASTGHVPLYPAAA